MEAAALLPLGDCWKCGIALVRAEGWGKCLKCDRHFMQNGMMMTELIPLPPEMAGTDLDVAMQTFRSGTKFMHKGLYLREGRIPVGRVYVESIYPVK